MKKRHGLHPAKAVFEKVEVNNVVVRDKPDQLKSSTSKPSQREGVDVQTLMSSP